MRWLLLGPAVVVVAGCTTVEKYNPFAGPATLKGEVTAGAQTNPDVRKRASPVVVRVFETGRPGTAVVRPSDPLVVVAPPDE